MAGVIIFKKNVSVVDKEYEREHVLFGFSSIPHAIHIDFKFNWLLLYFFSWWSFLWLLTTKTIY